MSAPAPLEWSIAARALPGESSSGDRGVVVPASGRALAAAVDGLGHGAPAAEAAEAAVGVLRRCAAETLASIVEHCHAALRSTRGAAMSVVSLDCAANALSWLAVGNVEGRLLRGGEVARAGGEPLVSQSGIVGYVLPPLAARSLRIRHGDVLVLATDGIGRGFADSLLPAGSPRSIADQILGRHALTSDDALVLVARYLGGRER